MNYLQKKFLSCTNSNSHFNEIKFNYVLESNKVIIFFKGSWNYSIVFFFYKEYD